MKLLKYWNHQNTLIWKTLKITKIQGKKSSNVSSICLTRPVNLGNDLFNFVDKKKICQNSPILCHMSYVQVYIHRLASFLYFCFFLGCWKPISLQCFWIWTYNYEGFSVYIFIDWLDRFDVCWLDTLTPCFISSFPFNTRMNHQWFLVI